MGIGVPYAAATGVALGAPTMVSGNGFEIQSHAFTGARSGCHCASRLGSGWKSCPHKPPTLVGCHGGAKFRPDAMFIASGIGGGWNWNWPGGAMETSPPSTQECSMSNRPAGALLLGSLCRRQWKRCTASWESNPGGYRRSTDRTFNRISSIVPQNGA